MKHCKVTKLILALVAVAAMAAPVTAQEPNSVKLTQGEYPLDARGYPEAETIKALYDEMDYQKAVQAYLWGLPMVVTSGQHKMNQAYGAKGNLDYLVLHNDPGVLGMLTPNTVVKYVIAFPNLKETGPLVLDMPGGQLVGLMMDYQMRWVADVGLTGKGGKGPEKILFLGPDQTAPENTDGYRVERVTSNVGFLAIRVLDPVKDKGLENKIKLYPYSKRNNPQPNPHFQAKATDETFLMTPPKGMEYWRRLHEVIQFEKVLEVDRYYMSYLQALGIEKGKPFKPTERQKKILLRAGTVAEKMAMALSFTPRSEALKYRDDTSWVHVLELHYYHKTKYTEQFDERVGFFWEAYGLSPAMKTTTPGKGSTYLGAYQDADGKWLDGGNTYKFHIGPNPPAAQFWDTSVYNLDTRTLILNGTKGTAVNSFSEGLAKNQDGSVDIYFGPKAPDGKESNWIKTNPGEYWFAYFRLYAPTQAYFDRSWRMYDIERVK